jgi:N-acetylneuraminate lyase
LTFDDRFRIHDLFTPVRKEGILQLKGIYPALFTPFEENGAVSEPMLRRLASRYITSGVDGLFLCGGTGEGLLLSPAERKRVAEIVMDEVHGRAIVLVHVGSIGTRECMDLARHAQEIGADGISAVPPFYYNVSPDGIFRHYSQIASVCDLPLLLYNIPTAVQVTVTPEMMSRLLEIPTVCGIKFSSYHLFQLWQMLQLDPGRLRVLSGNDEVMLAAFSMGAHGAIGLTLNLMPRLYCQLYRSFTDGDLATAKCLQDSANRVIRVLLQYPVIPAGKAAMRLRGYDCGPCRGPLETLDDDQSERLSSELRQAGFFELE